MYNLKINEHYKYMVVKKTYCLNKKKSHKETLISLLEG